MTAPLNTDTVPPSEAPAGPTADIAVDIAAEHGWSDTERGHARCWFKGYLRNGDRALSGADAAEFLIRQCRAASLEAIAGFLATLDGHFALVLREGSRTLAATDRARTTPLFFAAGPDGKTVIADRPRRLAERLGLGASDIDPLAAAAFALSGYTLGATTLYPAIAELAPGELALWQDESAAPLRRRYSLYRPERALSEPVSGDLKKPLRAVTLRLFEKLIADADGRPIVVPLSGGLDSRLIVAALVHLGCRDIRTFSYGLPGNFEATTAEKVADALGIPWRFAPSSPADHRAFHTSALHADYLDYADTLSSLPNNLELPYIDRLRADGYIPAESVLVNGQSGDFITGAHIPPALIDAAGTPECGWETMFAAYRNKHYGHWRHIATANRFAALSDALHALRPDGDGDPALLPYIYESLEFDNRQAKYVITGQRIYDFLGFDWRLPLWDTDYIDLWERMPLAAKRGQRLYREMLAEENWGGVWTDAFKAPQRISPAWIRPVRLAAKLACAPFGRAAWHRAERRYLQYWMHNTCSFAHLPYRRVASDRRGFRSSMSWRIEAYLADKGLALEDCGGDL
jgi:asparagine synthase (glutamine-hydrolysing)